MGGGECVMGSQDSEVSPCLCRFAANLISGVLSYKALLDRYTGRPAWEGEGPAWQSPPTSVFLLRDMQGAIESRELVFYPAVWCPLPTAQHQDSLSPAHLAIKDSFFLE